MHGHRLGVAGVKGFGGGFAGACASNFGEREMKDFVGTTEAIADQLGAALRGLDCDALVALTHYAPVPETLVGEPLEIYPFLGSLPARPGDRLGADRAGPARARAPRHANAAARRAGCRSATSPTR